MTQKQEWEAPLNGPTQRGFTPTGTSGIVASSAVLAVLSPPPQFQLQSGQLTVGDVIEWEAFGVLSTTGTPTLTLGLYYGSATIGSAVALAITGAITTGTTVTNVPWHIDGMTIIRAIGATGSAISQGYCGFGTAVGAWSFLPMPNTALATVAIDTTLATPTLQLGATWSVSSASNTVTCHGFVLK